MFAISVKQYRPPLSHFWYVGVLVALEGVVGGGAAWVRVERMDRAVRRVVGCMVRSVDGCAGGLRMGGLYLRVGDVDFRSC